MTRIAVFIPCLNEEGTVAKVVGDFRRVLPDADVYVYDNGSTDGTARAAAAAGAKVVHSPLRGKGNVTRQFLREVDADAYLMVDGDDTYPAEDAPSLLAPVLDGEADMVVGDRLSNGSYSRQNKRAMHGFGNALVCSLVNSIYKSGVTDVMTGYRSFSAAFAKTYPVTSSGFEVETEMTVHCLDKGMRVRQVPIEYRDRPEGSASKLDTLSDGMLVVKTVVKLFSECRPMRFFGMLGAVLLCFCLLCGLPVLAEYAQTSYVSHVPLALAAVGCAVLSMLSAVCGIVLDAMANFERRMFEMSYVAASRAGKQAAADTGEEVGCA